MSVVQARERVDNDADLQLVGADVEVPREWTGERQVNQGVVAETEGFEPSIRLYKRITV